MKVFYSPRQSVADNSSFSPSAGKPERVVEQWLARFPIEIVEPEPVTPAELAMAHDRSYVDDVLACRTHNGFGNRSRAVAESLPWTTGSMVAAARHVLSHGGAACSPTSGFHHACYARGGGFCTFNGLMVTAMLVRDRVQRVGILDCDFHYGNGTDDIMGRLRADFVQHYTTGHPLLSELGPYGRTRDPEGFLERLPDLLADMRAGLLLYQAGADAHRDDPLGGWMTDEQMRRRDRTVFRFCRAHGVPVVWNLAGGYQDDFQRVLDLHHATMEECLAAFQDPLGPSI
ncbi:MAG: histone deacetylase [Candidatus Eremiobacterota bacterium]